MFSKLKWPALVASAGLALALVPTALAAAGGGVCQLNGTAAFSPGLGASAQNFSYSFSGSLTQCQSNVSGAPASGTVSAGKVVNITGGQPTAGQEQFQEPVATGNGGCSSSTTSGIAIATWADGTQTVLQYATTGAAAAVELQGSVLPSVTLQAINPIENQTDPSLDQPTSTTITTTRWAGYSPGGVLAFQPPDPTACNTSAGVTTAGISGFIGLGSSS